MSIKKLLLCVAAMAIAMTAFASSAMAAEDGVIKDDRWNRHPERHRR